MLLKRGVSCVNYQRREPENSTLYRVIQDNLQTFLEQARDPESGSTLPRFVAQEFHEYLRCGILAYGFARVRCADCGDEKLVGFSCKRRGFCPSCAGRRMASLAARLTDRVFPPVPIRQWVLTLPFDLRYRMANNPALTSRVLALFLDELFCWITEQCGTPDARCGAVTVIQRFGSSLNLNPHFHALVPDGAYVRFTPSAALEFVPLPHDPDFIEIVELNLRIADRIRSELADPEELESPALDEEATLALCGGAAVQGVIAFGERAGRPIARARDASPRAAGRRAIEGFNLHASQPVQPHDRAGLERLIRYTARPPLAEDRLRLRADGQLALRLRRPWSDGTTEILFEPLQLLERLAALVPRPHSNLVRYHGFFAPAAPWRPEIVPAADAPHRQPPSPADPNYDPACQLPPDPSPSRTGRWLCWSALLLRVFGFDVLQCTRCGGRMKPIAFITDPPVVQAILTALELPTEPPLIAPATVELELFQA